MRIEMRIERQRIIWWMHDIIRIMDESETETKVFFVGQIFNCLVIQSNILATINFDAWH